MGIPVSAIVCGGETKTKNLKGDKTRDLIIKLDQRFWTERGHKKEGKWREMEKKTPSVSVQIRSTFHHIADVCPDASWFIM